MVNKRVLFIYPPSDPVLREDRCPVPAGNEMMSPQLPPTDLMCLAAVAEEVGYECMIRDYSGRGHGYDRFMKDLRQYRPGILVVSMTSPTIKDDIKCVAEAKRLLPGIRIIAKSAHFLKYDCSVMEAVPALDMVIRGEAEFAFREFLRSGSAGSVPGLTWRSGDSIIRNPDRRHEEDDPDMLPFPARHLVNNRNFVRPDNGRPLGVIRVSRGCPQGCFFCLATPVHGRKVRKRSIDSILKEIEVCKAEYGISDFIFWSDLFNHERDWVLNLCDAILSSGLFFRWSANIRVDRFDIEMAEAMKAAGCELVSVGVESGNQKMLDLMGKGIRLEECVRAFSIIRKARLKGIAYFLIGLPWETEETVTETIRFARELDCDYASFFVCTPLPGTRFHEYVLEKGLSDSVGAVSSDFRDAYYNATVPSHFLEASRITKLKKKAVRSFYLRPGYILRQIRYLNSLTEVSRALRAGLSLLRSAV
jgi:radical SAM superfamily enzyme YgiQ (UPF0313 family)